MIFAFIIFKEEITGLKYFCMLLMLLGTYMMQQRVSPSHHNHQSLIYALGSAFPSVTSILAK